jgi:hypothetical protein
MTDWIAFLQRAATLRPSASTLSKGTNSAQVFSHVPHSRRIGGGASAEARGRLPGKTLIEINGARSTGLVVVGWKDGAADEADRRGAFGWLGLLSV